MKFIDLTYGGQAKVDDVDYEWLNRRDWYALKDESGHIYVRTLRKKGDSSDWPKQILMHRLIIARHDGAGAIRGRTIDHINGDSLDNRRENLKAGTRSQRYEDYINPPEGEIPYFGVYRDRERGFYVARIRKSGNKKFLGRFDTAEEAARAYNEAVIEGNMDVTLNKVEGIDESN